MINPWKAARLAFLIPLACVAASPAQGTDRLVTFAALEKRLGDPNLRILDVRPKADYDKGHIPGAAWVDAKAVQALSAKPGALADRKAWDAWIAPLGIGPETDVLVYDANRQLDAARLWWLLGYLGVERAGLIDGSFPLWQKENRPVTTEVPTVEPKPFMVAFRTDRHATKDEVLAALGDKSAVIVDARSNPEYTGLEKRAKRGGHIPTACHLEWSNLIGADGRFLDESALQAKLAKAGVKPGEPIITHCQSGGRASVNAFVFERLGIKTRNYYAGWSDWGNAEATPIDSEPGAESKK
jgi:thiosulfate/3-mercaptopyruvate sulfurtransferase